MKIVNLTPHKVHLVNEKGELCVYEPERAPARVQSVVDVVGSVNGIPLTDLKWGKTIGLPKKRKDTIFIVSKIVAENNRHRDDLFIVGETIKNEAGYTIGAHSLSSLYIPREENVNASSGKCTLLKNFVKAPTEMLEFFNRNPSFEYKIRKKSRCIELTGDITGETIIGNAVITVTALNENTVKIIGGDYILYLTKNN